MAFGEISFAIYGRFGAASVICFVCREAGLGKQDLYRITSRVLGMLSSPLYTPMGVSNKNDVDFVSFV